LTPILTFFHRKFCPGATFLLLTNRIYCHYRPPKPGRSPAGPLSAVRCSVSQHSNQFLVSGCV
jgi:hypothetical protein